MSIEKKLLLIESNNIQYFMDILENLDWGMANVVLDFISAESTSVMIARPCSLLFVDFISKAPQRKELYQNVIEALSPRLVSFEESVSLAREQLAMIYESELLFVDAAKQLIAIPLESGHRQVTDEYKFEIYIKIMRNLLKSGDPAQAESYVARAGFCSQLNCDVDSKQQFRMGQAAILEYKRKYMDAAMKYMEFLSNNEMLESAIRCVLLSDSNEMRQKLCSDLFNDVRSMNFAIYPILKETYFGNLISFEETKSFFPSDWETALQQHNLTAVSRLYVSISFETLSRILQVPLQVAESVAVKMISDLKINGTIDQIDGYVDFHQTDNFSELVSNLCLEISSISNFIK